MLADTYLRSVAGDDQRFDVAPGTLAGGFLNNDIVTFKASRNRGDAVPEITVNAVFVDVARFRVVVPEAETASFSDLAPTDLHWSVSVTRNNGDGPYTLDQGIWRVEAAL
jgi:hypothetical protein